jgi:small basic protein (TIGR04137 family)
MVAAHGGLTTLDHGPLATAMSIDKSLKRKNTLARGRNVLSRGERILKMQDDGRWVEGRSPFGLPKVRGEKLIVAKKVKKEKAEDDDKGKGKKGGKK